jgi:aminopeptidase N
MVRQTRDIQLKDYKPSSWQIHSANLLFDLYDDHALVHARLELSPRPGQPPTELRLVGEALDLVSVAVDGAVAPSGSWRVEQGELILNGLRGEHVVETVSRIRPAANTELSGLYLSDGIFCTQCEAEGFRRITWFLDRPDVMCLFTTTIQADRERCPVLLSNGNLEDSGELEDGRHWARWSDPFPKPSYLFAMVAGRLEHIEDRFTTASGQDVALRIYTEAHNVHKCGFAMESLKRAMAWDEQAYGREYDLDIFMIVAVDAFNMGAMENKGLNIFNSSLVLALPEATTDDTFDSIEGVVAHEYFHNWTGNRITCRDWFQITLKEGLTVFRDQEFSADMGSRAVCRISAVQLLRGRQFPEDASPMAHPIQPVSYQKIDNFYTATVYEKGAEVIRMMHTLLGPEGWRRGMDCYFARHDGQAVTTEDFVKALEDGSGRDLGQFRRWYRQVGTPRLTVRENWDPAGGELHLELSQQVPGWAAGAESGPLHIPLAIGLLDEEGRELPTRLHEEADAQPAGTRLLELRDERRRFTFTGLTARPHLSLLRGFSAPVRVERETAREELGFLLARDSDAFARWEAGQALYTRSLLAAVEGLRKGRGAEVDPIMLVAWGATLADADQDPAFIALALQLPGYTVLEQEYDEVPVEALVQALDLHRRQLAVTHGDALMAVYERYARELAARPYDREPRSAGQRTLKNACLALLGEAEVKEAARLAMRQYRGAQCMSDTMGALAAMTHCHRPEREEALADFAARWGQDPVVMNSWFAVQAVARREDTLERIGALMQHPAFDIKNPNKVRALISTFAARNPARFHKADGSAYRFFTDRVVEVDALNATMGSSMVRPLMSWRRHEPARAALLKEQLERLAATEGLSANSYEIVSKSLAEA